MLKKTFAVVVAMALSVATTAADKEIRKVRHAGPFSTVSPIVLDSVDNAQKKYSAAKPLDMRLPLSLVEKAPLVDMSSLCVDSAELHLVAFDVVADKYLKEEYGYTYKESLFSMKPILKSSEVDDSRPTAIRVLCQNPTFVSVLSGKINTVYDLDEYL